VYTGEGEASAVEIVQSYMERVR